MSLTQLSTSGSPPAGPSRRRGTARGAQAGSRRRGGRGRRWPPKPGESEALRGRASCADTRSARTAAGWVHRQADLESRYQDAFETCEAAVILFERDPVFHARRIGEDCRAALEQFTDAALTRYGVDAPSGPGAGTVDKLRALLGAAGRANEKVSAHRKALVTYWGTVGDVDNRQAHKARREGERLTREDARRAILYSCWSWWRWTRPCPRGRLVFGRGRRGTACSGCPFSPGGKSHIAGPQHRTCGHRTYQSSMTPGSTRARSGLALGAPARPIV